MNTLAIFILFWIKYSQATNTTYHWSIGSLIIVDPTIQFRLDIYSPTTPGSYPVLIFLPGFAGLVPAPCYESMVTTIAEQNVIVIGISKIENIKPEKIVVHLSEFLDWIVKPNDGAIRLFSEQKSVRGVIPNMTRLGFLSHSAGAHPIGQYLNGTCGSLKLIIMMNPVDGIDPFGKIQDFITHPPAPLPFRIPTLIIRAGLDDISVAKGMPACAPNNMSNDRWYRSLYGPTFLINITDYGHADNLDEPFHEASKAICKSCKKNDCNFRQFKFDEASLITTFVYGIFDRNLQQINTIENPEGFIASHVVSKYDLHDYDYKSGGPGGFCTHD